MTPTSDPRPASLWRAITAPSKDLSPTERTLADRFYRATAILCVVLALLALHGLAGYDPAGDGVDAGLAFWANLVTVRLPVAVGALAAVALATLVAWKGFRRTQAGKVLTHWKRKAGGAWPEEPVVRAAKLLGGALIFAATLLATAWILGRALFPGT